MLPRMLKAFNAYIDGENFIGLAVKVKLPELKVKTDDYRGGGMDTAIEVDMGLEKLEATITLAEYSESVASKLGLLSADTPIVLRGSIQRQGGVSQPVTIRMTGGVKTIKRDDWESGKNSQMDIEVSANRYKETINGVDVVEIDVINMVRIIGGVDQLATMRADIGV